MVKAYGTLLDHLKGKAQRRMLADGVPSQERQTLQLHINMLETTRQVMNEKRHLASAQKIGKEFVAQKKLNLNVLYPRLQESIRDCVKAWNQSELNQEHLAKLADIYKKAVATRRVYATDFQHCVQYLVFCLALLNSNRKNSIELLRVKDFSQARKVYQEDEGKQLVSEGGEYFGKVVELLPSSGPLKGGAPVTMFFNTHVLEMMNMVADLARWFFVGEMKPRVSTASSSVLCNKTTLCSAVRRISGRPPVSAVPHREREGGHCGQVHVQEICGRLRVAACIRQHT